MRGRAAVKVACARTRRAKFPLVTLATPFPHTFNTCAKLREKNEILLLRRYR